MNNNKGLMLAKEFFRSISSGCRTGVLKFRNGDFAYVNSKNLSINMTGDIYTVIVRIGFDDSIKLEFNDEWKLLPILQQGVGSLNEWDVISAQFDDMAYYVEQVAAGIMKGYFYTATGDKLKATQETVELSEHYTTLRTFTIIGPKDIKMTYRVELGSDICNHGQLAGLNLIDFIEEEDV